MAISPDIVPRAPSAYRPEIKARVTAVYAPKYDTPSAPTKSSRVWRDRSDTNANSSMPYIFGVMALVAVGYVGYAYYGPVSRLDVATNQSSTTVRPAVVFTSAATAPVAPAASPAAAATAPAIATTP